MNDSCIQKFDNFEIGNLSEMIDFKDSLFVNMAKTVTMLSLYYGSGKI